ncbi:PREDICTED: beta-1,4-galactosyltransferase 7-like, partial [Amphimedon queenslandica]|uniref:Galactosyltransferase C-terminal domain-containing protein n=1 Tax=Amphimedon queenslandica TaxID=400682 RepID=A0AAN0IK87_AMPQE
FSSNQLLARVDNYLLSLLATLILPSSIQVNGLTNIFWGWGREDDELYLRIKEAGLQLHRPAGITTGNKTFRHNHDRKVRPRDMKSYGTQWRLSRRRDRESGLHTLKFEVLSIHNMSINGAPFKLANLELHCDYQKTPFCDHPS